jgi:hypothetical protein
MGAARAFVRLLISIAILAGCSSTSDPSGGLTIGDLAGDWNASEFRFTSVENPSESAELIEEGGSAAFTISSDGAYTMVVTTPEASVDTTQGFMVLEQGFLLVTNTAAPGSTTAFLVNLAGTTLTMTTDEADFDFDGDGTEEPARLRIVLARIEE